VHKIYKKNRPPDFEKKWGFPKTPKIRKTQNRQVQALITQSDPTGSGSYLVVTKGAHPFLRQLHSAGGLYGSPNFKNKIPK